MPEYIEREAVLNDIAELFTLCHETLPNECGHHFVVEKELETHWDFVKNLPTADVRPVVRAVWRRYSPFTDTYECSNCGEQVIDQQFRTNYCPNCGADMRPQPPKEET